MPSLAGSKNNPVSTLPETSSSITAVGGMRPPVPITIGGGSELPVDCTATLNPGDEISVTVRLVEPLPPVRNSVMVPATVTASPTFAVGADDVKMNMPSDVASLLS